VYTRKSSEQGLEQDFNALDAQRESAEAYIRSQAHEGWRLIKTRYDDGGLSGGTLERPALQSLLDDIRARKVDVVVVYKVDRLMRSLADLAKLIEVFEASDASFVAVTQQFNTTTSMGRLTLNVLLSFAQFERELAGEPVQVVSKCRVLTSGRVLGGNSFGRGALYHLLQNRIYLGQVVHRGVSYPGEQERIVDDELWDAVQTKLEANRGDRRRLRVETGALLGGLLFDDRGNLMSPTYAIKRGNRYRYYVSRALVRGRKQDAGSHGRVAADDLERLVVEVLAQQFPGHEHLTRDLTARTWSIETRSLLRDTVARIVVREAKVQIFLKVSDAMAATRDLEEHGDKPRIHTVKLPAAQPRARKEIIVPGESKSAPRRISHGLVVALARANTWMKDLRARKYGDTEEIARLRFCYLASDIVEAIVEGRQPRSLTVKRLLKGIPRAWPDQRAAFGFPN